MRPTRALLIVVIFVLMTSAAVTQAFAWYWPILGFQNTCNGYHKPEFTPVPGTLAWQHYPYSERAQMVLPGVSYCPSIIHLGFGFSPGNFGPPDTESFPVQTPPARDNETGQTASDT